MCYTQFIEITLPDNIAGIYGHALEFVDKNAVLKGMRGSVADKFLQSTDNSKTKVLLEKTSYTYNGRKKKSGVTVVMNGRKLTDGLDYRISYQNNTKVGTASVKIDGIGNYTGQKIKKFQIIPKGTQVKGKIMAKHKAFTLNWKKKFSSQGSSWYAG